MQPTSTLAHKSVQIPEGLQKAGEFLLFCQWSARPKDVRTPKDQKEFAEEFNLDEATLSLWKRTEQFEWNRRLFIRQWLGDDLPDVMNTVKKGALRGNPSHIDTFLRWLGELSVGSPVAVQINNNAGYSQEDIAAGTHIEDAFLIIKNSGLSKEETLRRLND